jgi:hypothetical protein
LACEANLGEVPYSVTGWRGQIRVLKPCISRAVFKAVDGQSG